MIVQKHLNLFEPDFKVNQIYLNIIILFWKYVSNLVQVWDSLFLIFSQNFRSIDKQNLDISHFLWSYSLFSCSQTSKLTSKKINFYFYYLTIKNKIWILYSHSSTNSSRLAKMLFNRGSVALFDSLKATCELLHCLTNWDAHLFHTDVIFRIIPSSDLNGLFNRPL